jgi:hypothetical protein
MAHGRKMRRSSLTRYAISAVSRASCALSTHELPTKIAYGKRIIVLNAERAGIVQRAIANHGHHGNAQSWGNGQRFKGVRPAHAAAAAENTRADGGGMLSFQATPFPATA